MAEAGVVRCAMVMAGGAGTRFWPASRVARPKQLLPLASGRSLLAATMDRLTRAVGAQRTLVVTSAHLEEQVRAELAAWPETAVLSEPVGRNTAPCVGLACVWLQESGVSDDAVLGVFPSDHWIGDDEAFAESVELAYEAAARGGIVTIGIRPTAPETGYGYLRHGPVVQGVAPVLAFLEKPAAPRALELLAGGDVLWNSGMFVFRIGVMLAEIRAHMPHLSEALEAMRPIIRAGLPEPEFRRVYAPLEAQSIDYGVMEHASEVCVVPGSFPWSDVGHWDALPLVAESDHLGNVVQGLVVAEDCRGSVVVNESQRVIAALGLEDMVVVDTGDALLVMPRSRAQEVRRVVERVRELDETLV